MLTQGFIVSNVTEISQFSYEGENLTSCEWILIISLLPSHEQRQGPSFKQTWIPLYPRMHVHCASLVETSLGEKDILFIDFLMRFYIQYEKAIFFSFEQVLRGLDPEY